MPYEANAEYGHYSDCCVEFSQIEGFHSYKSSVSVFEISIIKSPSLLQTALK
ncbi:MAG: hypothetical protein ACI9XO_002608 [Paraglaciecola sp.]|jgi:hypothetical protein